MAQIIEAAYLTGFEPSSDNLTTEDLFAEASAYLQTAIRF
jgi:hypothetical protein